MPTFDQIQQEIANMLDVQDDELTPEQRALMDAYLNELGNMEADKVDSFGQFIRLQSELAEACKAEAQRLAAKAKAAENRLAWLKEQYKTTMHTAGVTKVAGKAYTLSLRESEAVTVTLPAVALPAVYRRSKTTIEPDKHVIKEALKAGIPITGCELVKTYSLQVR